MRTFPFYLSITILFICLFNINPYLISQPATSLSGDQIYQTSYKARNEASGRSTYTYDLNGKITNTLFEKEIDGQWIPFSRRTNSYDSRSNWIYRLDEVFVEGSWINSSKLENTYDDMNHRTSQVHQKWQGEKWVNINKSESIYNDKGKMLKEISYKWINEEWQLATVSEATYDDNGNPIVSHTQSWDGGKLVFASRVTYTYNHTNKLLSFTRESLIDGVMVFISRTSDVYDNAGNYLYQLQEVWDKDKWVNSKRSTTFKDTSGYNIGQLDEVFVDGTWVNSLRSTTIHNTLGLAEHTLSEKWINDKWDNYQEINCSYYDDNSLKSYHTLSWEEGKWVDSYRSSIIKNAMGLKSAYMYEKWQNGKLTAESYKFEYEYRSDSSYRSLDYNTWQGDGWAPSNTTLLFVDEFGNPYTHDFCYHMDMIYLSEVNVKEEPLHTDIFISPNPASNFIELTSFESVTKRFNCIRIYDARGNLISLESAFGLEKQKIDISSLLPGAYVIIYGDRMGRFIKQ